MKVLGKENNIKKHCEKKKKHCDEIMAGHRSRREIKPVWLEIRPQGRTQEGRTYKQGPVRRRPCRPATRSAFRARE